MGDIVVKHVYTPAEDNFLRENYGKLSYREMAACLGLSASQVRHRIERHIIDDFHKEETNWSDEELRVLIQNYNKPYKELLGLLPNKRVRTIQMKLAELGINRQRGHRKHFVKPNYFRKWTPNMAYIVGLLAADGTVYSDGRKNNGKIMISLKKSDRKLLEEIALELGLDSGAVHDRNSCNMAELVFYDKDAYECLAEIGVKDRKSLSLNWIDVPEEYVSHFVRGYFDGDGSIILSKSGNYVKPIVQFLGTEHFLYGLTKTIDKILGVGTKNINATKTRIKCLRYVCAQAVEVLCWMYEDIQGKLYLPRKYDKFASYMKKVQRPSKSRGSSQRVE